MVERPSVQRKIRVRISHTTSGTDS
jgi:hypothetical protein